MKKVIVFAATLMLVAFGANASQKALMDVPPAGEPNADGLLDCTGAASVTCGDVAPGACGPGGNVDNTYGCTTLSYLDCQEIVYEVCLGGDGDLTVDMNYLHSADNDLDLFLLGSCEEADCLDSSTGTSGAETVELLGAAAGTYYVVVDGWNSGTGGRCDGSVFDVTINCGEGCGATAVDPATWGEIKSAYGID